MYLMMVAEAHTRHEWRRATLATGKSNSAHVGLKFGPHFRLRHVILMRIRMQRKRLRLGAAPRAPCAAAVASGVGQGAAS